MKTILLLILLLNTLHADISLDMNIKRLYKDVSLSAEQKDYLHSQQNKIINLTTIEANKLIDTNAEVQGMQGKTTVSFVLSEDGDMQDFYFINESKKTSFNNFVRDSVEVSYYKYPVNDVDVLIRIEFILTPTSGTQNNDKMNKMKNKMENFATKHPNMSKRRNQNVY